MAPELEMPVIIFENLKFKNLLITKLKNNRVQVHMMYVILKSQKKNT
jgi:hypothetical protein